LCQPLSANTKGAYRTRVSRFLEYLVATPAEYGDPLGDLHARDYAVRDYKSHLKVVRRAKPSSVNLSLATIDNFYLFLGMGRPEVRRERLAQAAPRSLAGAFTTLELLSGGLLMSGRRPDCDSGEPDLWSKGSVSMGPNAPISIDPSLHIQLQQTIATADCVDVDLHTPCM
jgi:hypothetical protein